MGYRRDKTMVTCGFHHAVGVIHMVHGCSGKVGRKHAHHQNHHDYIKFSFPKYLHEPQITPFVRLIFLQTRKKSIFFIVLKWVSYEKGLQI